jgi:inner membrane protein involved in colicin E2 resistance
MEIVLQLLFAGISLLGMVLLVVFVIEFREDSAAHPHYRAPIKGANPGRFR